MNPATPPPTTPQPTRRTDVAVIGGGIAGLWCARRLADAGYGVVLFERGHTGGVQTLGSQGIIHGGLKYSLSGTLSRATAAISAMPERWRACLSGCGEIDLTTATIRTQRYAMFAGSGFSNRLTGLVASQALRGRVLNLERAHWPDAFHGFTGQLWQLDDLVVDVASVCQALANHPGVRLYSGVASLRESADGWRVASNGFELSADVIVAAAGLGNEQLIDQAGIDDVPTQRRGLCQLIVRSEDEPLPELNGHCITGVRGSEPRLSITSHDDGATRLWTVGGRLATRGAALSDREFLTEARSELEHCLPWLDLSRASLSTWRVDRAEPAQHRGLRPDDACVIARRNLLLCWPSKLTLAPSLGDQVLDAARRIAPPSGDQPTLDLDAPAFGRPPW